MKLTRKQIAAIEKDREEWFRLFHDGERPEKLYDHALNMGVRIGAERALGIFERRKMRASRDT